MIIKQMTYNSRDGFQIKNQGGDREVCDNLFNKIIVGVTYNFQSEIEKYPDEKDAVCLTDKEAAEIILNEVVDYSRRQIKIHKDIMKNIQKRFNNKSWEK